MSQKWVRSKQWDDQNVPPAFEPARYWMRRVGAARFLGALAVGGAAYAGLWLGVLGPALGDRAPMLGWLLPLSLAIYLVWPVKFLLRTFSSIPLAVVLLTLVAVYGTLASVPIGLVAKLPTLAIYGVTILAVLGVVAVLPTWVLVRGLRAAGAGRGLRFVAGFFALQVLAVASIWLWNRYAWPRLHYDPIDKTGLLLFADFVDKYKAVTLRRLPGLEMSELEFYGWWPLRVILLLFVANMVMATVRRIEFTFPNIGVLTVHTGIVTIALGSVYYQRLKVEGDMLLLAGDLDARGVPAPGPLENRFYDNTDVALWIAESRRVEQRWLRGLPRYNDYNLNALELVGWDEAAREWDEGRRLDLVPVGGPPQIPGDPPVAADLDVRVVGYSSYSELAKRRVPAPAPADPALAQPSRQIVLLSALPEGFVPEPGKPTPAPVEPRAVGASELIAAIPAKRVLMLGDSAAVEYTRGMSEARWNDLKAPLPVLDGQPARHGLVVEVPPPPGIGGSPVRAVYAVQEGTTISVGTTGYTLEVRRLAPEPPMPLVTPGFENATSSLAVVRVTPPTLAGGEAAPAFERWIYSRFPEITQDLVDDPGNTTGMPRRRAADPAIKISYIDASIVQVYVDEPAASASEADPAARVLVRIPGREPGVIPQVKTGERVQIDRMAYIGLGPRVAHTVDVEFPVPTPESRRDKQAVGTHGRASIAVRVAPRVEPGTEPAWTRTVWVPFDKYARDPSLQRTVKLPDGRELGMAFSRRQRALPEMALRLTKFEMFPYEHSDLPRDYRSDVEVVSLWGGEQRSERRSTSLNEPLLVRVPYRSNERAPSVVNAVGWAVAQVAPEWYKFSQAGWDSTGWTQSKAAVEAGRATQPSARFTILGVGNNPGITIVAAGAVMMSLGIPWAFYIKPMIMRGRKRRLQRELAARGGQSAGAGATKSSGGRTDQHQPAPARAEAEP
jgi:hypothetical protein